MELIIQIIPFFLLHFCLGVSLGFPSILLVQLADDKKINLDKNGEGWIASLDYLMTGLLALIAGHFQAKYGPKKVSLASCIPSGLSWVLMAVAPDLWVIYLSRMLVGCGNGILLCSIYTVEVAPANLRGAVVMGEMVFRNLGMMVIFLVAEFLPWHTLAACIVPIPFLAMLLLMLMPESPIFLVTHRGYVNPDAQSSHSQINENTHGQSFIGKVHIWLRDFKKREVLVPFVLLILVVVAQECSGSKIIQGFAVVIFQTIYKSNPVSGGNPYISSMVMACIRLISTLVSAKIINHFGRKTMYSISAAFTIVFEILFGCNHFFNFGTLWTSLPIMLIYAQVCCLQIGLETFPQLLSSELFPNDVRAKAKGLIRAISSLLSFGVLKLFPIIKDNLGFHLSFLLFAFILVFLIPVILWFLPEVKDVDLDAIPDFFDDVKTVFYVNIFEYMENDEETGEIIHVKDARGNKNRIQMVDNIFGVFGKCLTSESETRTILAEGFLTYSNKPKATKKKIHFFLFNDMLVWGSVICQNRNYFRQMVIPTIQMDLEDMPATNSWAISTPIHRFTLEAEDLPQKNVWMKLMEYSIKHSTNSRYR